MKSEFLNYYAQKVIYKDKVFTKLVTKTESVCNKGRLNNLPDKILDVTYSDFNKAVLADKQKENERENRNFRLKEKRKILKILQYEKLIYISLNFVKDIRKLYMDKLYKTVYKNSNGAYYTFSGFNYDGIDMFDYLIKEGIIQEKYIISKFDLKDEDYYNEEIKMYTQGYFPSPDFNIWENTTTYDEHGNLVFYYSYKDIYSMKDEFRILVRIYNKLTGGVPIEKYHGSSDVFKTNKQTILNEDSLNGYGTYYTHPIIIK